jgi:hypothetical protein
MHFNAAKCGTFTPPDNHLFRIGGSPIPFTGSVPYKYLGFPLCRLGINWQFHVDQAVSKARTLLDHSMQTSFTWSEYSKMTVYKTFIRPIIEYGGGAFFHLIHRNADTGRVDLSSVKSLEEEALQWIFRVSRYTIALLSASAGAPFGFSAQYTTLRNIPKSRVCWSPLGTLLNLTPVYEEPTDWLFSLPAA